MIRRLLSALHPRSQPYMTRASYAREQITALTLPFGVGLMEAGVAGILARKTFDVSPLMFAIIMASPPFANITSFLWARAAKGRRKVRFISGIMVAFLVSLVLVAFLPMDDAGGYGLTLIVVLSRCLLAGVVTLRSTVWRMNYPKAMRAQITGKLALVASLIVAFVPAIGYACLDYDPRAFRVLYPAAALIGALGVLSFSKIRLRRERALLRFEQETPAKPTPHGEGAKVYEYVPKVTSGGFWSVLKDDHAFRRYQINQFILGTANIASMTAAVYVIDDMTRHLDSAYFVAILLSTGIPSFLATLTLPRWARYLDRVHIARFRVFHSLFFFVEHWVNWAAVLFGSLPLLCLGRTLQGFARGGALMAWQLGHNDFASRNMVAVYMGIHATLTGVRGSIAPFLAILLYTGFDSFSVGGVRIPGFDGIGAYVFLLCMALVVRSWLGFRALARELELEGH